MAAVLPVVLLTAPGVVRPAVVAVSRPAGQPAVIVRMGGKPRQDHPTMIKSADHYSDSLKFGPQGDYTP